MNEVQNLHQRIRELEASLAMPLPDAVRQMVESELATLRAQQQQANVRGDGTPAISGKVDVRDTGTADVAVGVNLGTIIYGRNPHEDERQRLVVYLQQLAAKLAPLPLRGLGTMLDDKGKSMDLSAVYTMLATRRRVEVARGKPEDLGAYFEDEDEDKLKEEYDSASALPTAALFVQDIRGTDEPARDSSQSSEPLIRLERAVLATEAVRQHRHMVLLGVPGGGKSTFVRHLAWALAQRGLDRLDDTTTLAGWDDQQRILPVVLPLRTLAGRLHDTSSDTYVTTVSEVLQDALAQCDYDAADARHMLRQSLRRGAALVLFDGLDEVPLEATTTTANRSTTLHAVRAFTRFYTDALVVVTCRTRAFAEELRAILGWQVDELAPFTLGQVRHFVAAWYRELAARTDLTSDQVHYLSRYLIDALDAADTRSAKLRDMAGTPLLLTMMALVVYNKGELPRDRPKLYEEILLLLLGQWDIVKYDGDHRMASLADAIGQPDWTSEYIRPLLDQVSYDAHATATSADGKGRLDRGKLFASLYDFFVEAGMSSADAGRATPCFLEYIDQRSGLLQADGDKKDSYVFAHLTLQEHCAGRHIALQSDDPAALVMQHRADDRWREPIFLGMGVADPRDVNSVLHELIDCEENEHPKPIDRWYRDLILAAELGEDRDWNLLKTKRQVKVGHIQKTLQAGLAHLLADPTQPLPAAERIRAGFLLGDLGDPRVPVTQEQWRATLPKDEGGRMKDESEPDAPLQDSSFQNYWCYVSAGTYRIGGWKNNEEHADITLPAFWIARYPVTVAQYAAFIEAGGYATQQWWTPNGWTWKQEDERTQPWRWDNSRYNGSNQAVTGVAWYEAVAFAAWLHAQLAGVLPAGWQVRLPTEAEWEAAAAYAAPDAPRRTYPWGEEEPTPERAIYKESGLNNPAPVGCCPAGAAACGTLDMVGQVWEWATSDYAAYPAMSGVVVGDLKPAEFGKPETWRIPVRGGVYYVNRIDVRCAARDRRPRGIYIDGLRLLLLPPRYTR